MNIEIDLITACIRKERKAQYELYKLVFRYLMSICIRYTHSYEDASEALNTGFLKILNNMDKYRADVPFKAWIRKIMVNVLIDEFRKQKKEKENFILAQEHAEHMPMVEINDAISRMDTERIHRLIMELPPVSQKVFNLYVVDGFEHKEIATMLGISEGTSKWHLHNSREQLKEKLAKAM
jgi:RNA polymerase sigma factor (sigma-70 family)